MRNLIIKASLNLCTIVENIYKQIQVHHGKYITAGRGKRMAVANSPLRMALS